MKLLQQTGQALGCVVVFTVRAETEHIAASALRNIRLYLADYENRFSRFLPCSELCRVDRQAGQWVSTSRQLRDFARVSNHMQTWSNGLYNPFILPDLQRAGYVGSFTGRHGREALLDMRPRSAAYGNATIAIRGNEVKIPAGTAFDSGGLGKGYALDQLADLLEERGIYNYLISLGGDIIARGYNAVGKPWRIELAMLPEPKTVERDASERMVVATSSVL